MRTALLRRRRRGPSLPADLVALLATEPTVLVQLRYNFLAGRYVLFQDPACTVPVEEVGDPIGGIIQPSLTLPPSDWSIVAVQGTDAARAVWGGVEVGAVFESGAHMISTDPDGFIPATAQHCWVQKLEIDSIANNDNFFSQFDSLKDGRMQANYDAASNAFRYRLDGGGTQAAFATFPGSDPLGDWVIVGARNGTNLHAEIYDTSGLVDSGIAAIEPDRGVAQAPSWISGADGLDRHPDMRVTYLVVGDVESKNAILEAL